MFTTFEAAHKTKVGEITVFESGLQAYKELLSFDTDRIMNQLDRLENLFNLSGYTCLFIRLPILDPIFDSV